MDGAEALGHKNLHVYEALGQMKREFVMTKLYRSAYKKIIFSGNLISSTLFVSLFLKSLNIFLLGMDSKIFLANAILVLLKKTVKIIASVIPYKKGASFENLTVNSAKKHLNLF